MAEHKDYGLTGVNQDLQLGKQGPHIKSNGDGTVSVTDGSGVTLTPMQGANAVSSSQFVTKAQFDVASKTYSKANLSAVYSDSSINAGDVIVVTDAGDGEYAVYLAKQSNPVSTAHLTLVSSKDSAGTDSGTLSTTVTFNSGTITLGDISQGSRPLSVVINVTTPFDGTTAITIGDDNFNARLMSTAYVGLSEQGIFVTNPSYVYSDSIDANNTLKVYVTAGDSTVGNATILVSYS